MLDLIVSGGQTGADYAGPSPGQEPIAGLTCRGSA